MNNSGSWLSRQALYLAFFWFIVVASAACTTQSESLQNGTAAPSTAADTLLNSERIRQRYGSYGVQVLYSDSTRRITSLYSVEGGVPVSRTIAVVLYPDAVDQTIRAEHALILAGGSIGEVFKNHGWTIEKRSIYFGGLPPSDDFSSLYSRMGGISPTALALYLYTFNATKYDRSVNYATIAEVYHPGYLQESDLVRLYPRVVPREQGEAEAAPILGLVQELLKRSF